MSSEWLAAASRVGRLLHVKAYAHRASLGVPGSDAYVEERVALARLLGQSNTYSTWSLSLKGEALLHRKFLYTAGRSVSPADLGVTETSTPAFLKALSLTLTLTLILTPAFLKALDLGP